MSWEPELLFSTPIWKYQIDDIDNRTMEECAYALKSYEPGVIVSNQGGWQSVAFNYSDGEDYHPILNKIVELLSEIKLINPIEEVLDITSWININAKYSYNELHNHIGVCFSGVYYIKVPDGDCGNIGFKDPRPLVAGDFFFGQRYEGGGYYSYPPKEGMLLLFPAFVDHMVRPNNTDKDRISIAFNIMVK
tara:strand:- start:525 stop:1097 length:573 start_codon:yes stop_codon:yes gene_type:complete